MAHDLLARLAATKEAAEHELSSDAKRTAAARLGRAVEDFQEVAASARELSELVAAHRDNGIEVAISGDPEVRLRTAADALTEASDLDGERAECLAIDTERAYNTAKLVIEAALNAARSEWLTEQPRPNDAFAAVFHDLAPSEMDATESAVADVEALAAEPVTSARQLEDLGKAVAILNTNYERLTETAPEIVREFLERVPAGLWLSEVSEEVLDWLREHSADAAFTISLRSE